MYRFLKKQRLIIRGEALQISGPRILNWLISGRVWLVIKWLLSGLGNRNYCSVILQQTVK